MENQDIRWKQRFQNFEKALSQLTDGIENYGDNPENIIKEGTVQRFEFTHELAWKIMKDFLEEEGIQNIMGSKSATRESFNKGLIVEGQIWMDMIKSRNETVHIYNEEVLDIEYKNIIHKYYPVIKEFYLKMKTFL